MFSFRRLIPSSLISTSMLVLLACGGEQELLSQVDNSVSAPDTVQIKTQVGHEALTATVLINPDQVLDVTIVNGNEEQLIQVTDGLEILFEQRLGYDGRLREITILDLSFSTNTDNSIKVPEGSPIDQYFRDCYERRILCHRDAAVAISMVQEVQAEVFTHFDGENALTGLEALERTPVTIIRPNFPNLPSLFGSFSDLSVDLAEK